MTRYFFILIILCSNVSANELLNITFLGTGNPRPNIDKLGPSVLIKVKNEEIMLDVGRGATLRLTQIGNNYSQIDNIYISHLHFDKSNFVLAFFLVPFDACPESPSDQISSLPSFVKIAKKLA